MLQSANASTEAITRAKFIECPTCASSKKPDLPRPALHKAAQSFGEALGVDIFSLRDSAGEQHHFLNTVDLCTRFQVCSRVANKTPRDVFKILQRDWLAWAGTPARILSDQGSEFTGPYLDLREAIGAQVHQIARDSP